MVINLQKGQRVDLTKGTSLNNLVIGLGWKPLNSTQNHPIQKRSTSLVSNLMDLVRNNVSAARGAEIDIDTSIFLLDKNNTLKSYPSLNDIVYFNNRIAEGILHKGDDRTGRSKFGVHDNEEINIELNKVSNKYDKLLVIANIYKAHAKGQHFGMVKDAYIRLIDKNTNEEIARYDLTGDYSNQTALILGEVYRHNNEWKFFAVGQGTTDGSIVDIAKRYK